MDTTVPVFSGDGSPSGTMEMQSAWIELEKGTQAVHDEVVAFLAMRRAGTASTKTRSEVRGGGAKPYRQKGTGRARAGSIRSPLWSGGGVIFGPKPRSYAKKVNKKVRQLALKRAFSERVAEGAVMVVDEITVAQPKTKAVRELLQSLKAGTDVLVIPAEVSETLLLASRNMPSVEVMEPTAVNTYWMLLFKKVVFTRAGLEAFVKRFAPKEEQA